MVQRLKNRLKKLKSHRILWFLTYIVLGSFTIFLDFSLWNRFTMNPTVITFEGDVHPVTAIPFPGISLCNINKISKRRAESLASNIAMKTGENFTKILNSMKYLGNLYDSNFDNADREEIEYLQTLLDRVQLKINELLKMLTTPCEDLLHECRWKGRAVNCSRIFNLRLTFEGHCCTFNYFKKTQLWWRRQDPFYGEPGFENALTVVINNDPEDYLYTIISSIGLNVHVFIPSDYPDITSGNLIENLVDMGTENFIEIVPETIHSVKDVMTYFPKDKRRCLFDIEQQTNFGVYSQSDCFVDCRIKSMMSLCGCVPFTIPWSQSNTVCSLRDLPCLQKYKTKWAFLVPKDISRAVEMREHEDGLACDEVCYPSCESTLYSTSTSRSEMYASRLSNSTTVHFFYVRRYHKLYKQDVVYYWFEILSNFGGIFGVVMGLSLLSLVESVIYCCKTLLAKC